MDKQIIAEWLQKWKINENNQRRTDVAMLSDFAAEFVPQHKAPFYPFIGFEIKFIPNTMIERSTAVFMYNPLDNQPEESDNNTIDWTIQCR